MLISESMRSAGERLFRRRSFVLLLFVPLLAWAVGRGEPVERGLGAFWGETFELACAGFVLSGLLLRVATVGFVPRRTSGRNTSGQVAETLNTSGVYSLCRNPLYLANCLIYVGIVLSAQNLLLALAFALFLALYYERIILAEEAFLLDRFGAPYQAWAADVPAFLPRLHGWKRPALPFSLRSVLRREPPSWLAAAAGFAAVDAAADFFDGEPLVELSWAIPLGLALAAVLVRLALERWSSACCAPRDADVAYPRPGNPRCQSRRG